MTPLLLQLDDVEHNRRVGELALSLARTIGLPESSARRIGAAATLHDVGKLGIPTSILCKPGPLTRQELKLVRLHTVCGEAILAETDVPYTRLAASIARGHHEWWDGSGYPDGLAGEEIPLPARIVALADVFDALTQDRPYRRALDCADALELIEGLAGLQFEPRLTAAFVDILEPRANVRPLVRALAVTC
ncbi:MAG TPA: HD-GYP domain-containing protein [Gaiellaceae bacterium]|nr:HD-GYP domain-containing protein [Gaiellaceae bacterium]